VRALVFEDFAGTADGPEVSVPEPSPAGVVVRVGATGVCRSDWHGWQGHDSDIVLPHVPGPRAGRARSRRSVRRDPLGRSATG
jgi:alcohol dehydrogenase